MPKRRQRDSTQLSIWDDPDAEHEKRACPVCHQPKPLTAKYWYPHHAYRQGFDNLCRDCRNEYKRSWNKSNGQAIRQRAIEALGLSHLPRYKHLRPRVAYTDAQHSAINLVSGARGRIKKHDRPFDPQILDRDFVVEWLHKQPACECCGRNFLLGPKSKATGLSPSFDRFDNDKGYTLSNTALICWDCNRIKGNHDAPSLRMVADWIDRTRETRAQS